MKKTVGSDSSNPCRPDDLPWWIWFCDLWGKLRRYYLVRFRKDYVQRMLELRTGECRRCAGCCSIAFKCPHLAAESTCEIYEDRYKQCRAFPIDSRDLLYRNCGFTFIVPEEAHGLREEAEGKSQMGTSHE